MIVLIRRGIMNKKFLISIIFLALAQHYSLGASLNPQAAIPQAGSINKHDLDIIRNYEKEKQIEQDYQNFKNREEKGETREKIEKKQKGKVEKAKKSEYATKGVYVEKIEVSPSQILSEAEIQNILDDYTQTNLTIKNLQEIVNKINKLYLQKGFVTARAYLPPQTIEGEVVRIELLEGKVGDVQVSNNRWTKTKYIEDRLGLQKGEIFNIQNLEEKIMVFNRYNDTVQLTGSLAPGKSEIGTTDVNIKANEKSPFHLSAMFDNAGRSSIGRIRSGVMLQHDSLFGRRDRFTIGTYANKHFVSPFVDYNIPVNKKDGRIGFNFSSNNSKIAHGPYRIFNIKSRSQNYSVYFTQPIYRRPWTELTSTTSLSYKRATTSFDGHDLRTDEVASAETGLSFRYDTKRGIWYLNQNVSYAFPLFDKNSNYLKLDGGIMRLHDFGHGIVGTLRGSYQVIPNKNIIPYIDQFMAGGVATVRGYSEGLLIGRNGYVVNAELMFPLGPQAILNRDKTGTIPFIGKFLKGFIFADHGAVFPYKGSGLGSEGYNRNDFLASIGVGIKINLPKDINLRLCWGFPLFKNDYEERSRWGRFHFDMSITPDFDALVKLRRPKEKNIEQVKLDDKTKVTSNIQTTQAKKSSPKQASKTISKQAISNKPQYLAYLALDNKQLSKEIVKPAAVIQFNNIDFKPIK